MAERVEQVQRAFTAYLVERELGSGGMATVYLAHDKKHDRRVAIKILHAELAAMLGAERFLQEIRVTANLQHPHILGFIDSGIVGNEAGELAAHLSESQQHHVRVGRGRVGPLVRLAKVASRCELKLMPPPRKKLAGTSSQSVSFLVD